MTNCCVATVTAKRARSEKNAATSSEKQPRSCGVVLFLDTLYNQIAHMQPAHHHHEHHAKGRGMNNTAKDHDTANHSGHSLQMFWEKFWICLVLTLPVVLYSDLTQKLFGFSASSFKGSQYLPIALGSIIFFYGGWVFLMGAKRELASSRPGMMTLISLAIITAYTYSIFGFLTGRSTLFWELTTLITIMLLGHWLEMKAVAGTQDALRELTKLLPDIAEVFRGEETQKISLGEIKIGDIALIRPGARIPVDGIVIEGSSEVDESIITGESQSVRKTVDDEAVAGALNSDGALKIRVTKIGEETFLAGVIRLVEQAQSSKSKLQILSDRAAFYLTLIAVLGGGATFIAWQFSDAGFSFAIERLVAVLVVACPHALGLAIPLVAVISAGLAARQGFLIRQRPALELARRIEAVLFDKTGTLTKGEYGVSDIVFNNDIPPITGLGNADENLVLQLAASLDAYSEHFVAQALVREAQTKNIKFLEIKDFVRLAGKGVKAMIRNHTVHVGGEAMLKEAMVSVSNSLKGRLNILAQQGKTLIYAAIDRQLVGVIALADSVREESRQAVQELKTMGIEVIMVTGDSEAVAKRVAKELDIDNYYAEVFPAEKSQIVELIRSRKIEYAAASNRQKQKPRVVAMVGDGINDAPALAKSDIGIAIGAGTNIAIESAGIILVKNDPRDVAKIIRLSRATYAKMMQNFFWAAGYNIIAMPLAAGVLYSKGIVLGPAFSAALMSLSTIIVALNAMLLRRLKF